MRWERAVCLAVALFSCDVQAVVALSGTRLIFDGRFHEVAFELSNPGVRDVLIQTWLESVEPVEDDRANLPFVVTPPLAQLPPQGRQTLRVLYEGVGLPRDRESLLHLYVLEVPWRSAANQQLSLAVRQRINVFYRPQALVGDPALAPEALSWQRSPDDPLLLNLSNPTPFHVSLHNIRVGDVEVSEDLLLGPFSTFTFRLPASLGHRSGVDTLTFKALTDYGGQRDFCAQPKDRAPFHARLRTPGTPLSIGKC
ncbi:MULTISPECIES: fimbrial biogenesis chaperone [unclassified Pseudomonas]|uniref:fimbrial biogenesis chaperone n=1 Tax=unclassified Pseudomonas TaxID=196821 RepID=UPI00384AD743